MRRGDAADPADDHGTRPGDLVFFAGRGVGAACIRFSQHRRVAGRYARWTHVAIIESVSPLTVIESTTRGVRRSTAIARGEETAIARIGLLDPSRVLGFARERVGKSYGFLDILSIGLGLLTGGKLVFVLDGSYICSQLVAEALERAGYDWPRDAASMSPGDLAQFLLVG